MCNLKTAKLQKQKFHLLKNVIIALRYIHHNYILHAPLLRRFAFVRLENTEVEPRCFYCDNTFFILLFYYSRRAISPLRRDGRSAARLVLSFPAILLDAYTVGIRAFHHR